jgi:hypothetical protein
VTYDIIFLCGPIKKQGNSLLLPRVILSLRRPIFSTSTSLLLFPMTAATTNKRPPRSHLSHLCSLLSLPPSSTTLSLTRFSLIVVLHSLSTLSFKSVTEVVVDGRKFCETKVSVRARNNEDGRCYTLILDLKI